MQRRDFMTLLGGAAAWPLAAHAQQADRVRRIGVLMGYAEDDPETKVRLAAFRQRLEKRGWSEGRNVQIETRFVAARADKYESLAKELVATQPDVILAHTTQVTPALQRESRTTPIVFVNVSDPIGSGFVGSLARPGGNFTGVLQYEASVVSGWRCLRKSRRVLSVWLSWPIRRHPLNDYFLRVAEAAATSLAIKMVPSPVATAADIEHAINFSP
jgi:putative tryptophan/tyrosine transport system substrate-binding protein